MLSSLHAPPGGASYEAKPTTQLSCSFFVQLIGTDFRVAFHRTAVGSPQHILASGRTPALYPLV